MSNIRSDCLTDARGATYLLVMFSVVLIGISLSVAAKQWKIMVQRELEADLLAKGIEIQTAIALYSARMKAGRVIPGEVYPNSLAELTRQPRPVLRKVYLDPVGRGEWELVRAPTGGIMGVRSRSTAKPLRQHDFPLPVRHFEGLPTYHDWVFQHPSPSAGSLVPLQPGVVPTSPDLSQLQPSPTPAPSG